MKSPTILLIIISFCVTAFAQSETSIALDFRPGLSDNSDRAGLTRSRTVAGDLSANKSTSAEAGRLEREVFDLLNAERRVQGLRELEWNEGVAAVARLHSRNMAKEKFFSHRGSDGSMVDNRADRLGLGAWNSIGENIAFLRGFENPAAIAVAKWIESTAHRKNLLGPNWTESAVGVVITSDGRYYLTQVFLNKK